MSFPPLLTPCQICNGMGFLPNPDLPDHTYHCREDWCQSTWYTAWDAVGETYGGTVLVCVLCQGTGRSLTPEGHQILELNTFVQYVQSLKKDGI